MDTTLTDAGLKKARFRARNRAFTLVELLVVITIISVLAALITVAAIGALKKAQEARIKAEINQIATAVDDYKNKTTAYPPNCENDSNSTQIIDSAGVLNDVRRHLKQIAPRMQEMDDWAVVLTGGKPLAVPAKFPTGVLRGGITAGEAVVFWLGGFSSDPKFPISGEGGPSYDVTGIPATEHRMRDPIESRKWIFPFDITRLGPRAADGYFDETNGRYVEFIDAKGKTRRINFWQYTPPKSTQPYLYFDTSRHPALDVTQSGTKQAQYDPPAATADVQTGAVHVHAFKKQNPAYTPTNKATTPMITFVNPDKYQILHSGLDSTWDNTTYDAFEKMSADNGSKANPTDFLLFPTGPFVGDVADTIVNFTPETRIEDAQK